MTTIITRLYKDDAAAKKVVKALDAAGFPDDTVDMISGGDDAMGKMTSAQVSEANAKAYAPKVADGATLVVVRAPFVPFGAARAAMDIVDAGSPMAVKVENANQHVGDTPSTYKELRIQHRYWADFLVPLLSSRVPPKESTIRHGFYADFLVPHLSKRTPSKEQTIRPGYWADFLVPHLSKRKPSKEQTIRPGYWADFIMPHLIRSRSTTTKADSRFPFSNAFGLPMLIKR